MPAGCWETHSFPCHLPPLPILPPPARHSWLQGEFQHDRQHRGDFLQRYFLHLGHQRGGQSKSVNQAKKQSFTQAAFPLNCHIPFFSLGSNSLKMPPRLKIEHPGSYKGPCDTNLKWLQVSAPLLSLIISCCALFEMVLWRKIIGGCFQVFCRAM